MLVNGDPGSGGDIVVGVLDPRLGEDLLQLRVHVEVKGSLHVSDDGELGELL